MSRRRTHQTTVPGELPRGPVDDIVWLVLFWVLSRIVMLCLWQALCGFIRNDVNYYAMSVAGRSVPVLSDLTGVLEEYPAPLVWLLQLLEAPSGGSVDLYVLLFGLLIAVADGACCLALRRRESALAAWVWAICGALLGPLLWFRLDIAPALCVLGALHWMRRRPALSGVLLALGAGFKLWPALLILPMLGRSRAARHRGAGFVVTGSALVLVSLLTSGLARTCSPLGWQSGRGLQIESVWATPLMLARALGGTDVNVAFSGFKAYEVFSPAVAGWRTAAGVSMLVLIALTLVLSTLIVLSRGEWGTSPDAPPTEETAEHEWAVRLAVLAIIAGWIVVNKTLSPQYMIWLFGPLAVIASSTAPRSAPPAQAGRGVPSPQADQEPPPSPTGRDRAPAARRLVTLGLVSVALTQLVYPLTYSGLIALTDPSIGATMLLVLRNLAMVALAVAAWGEALRTARRPRRTP